MTEELKTTKEIASALRAEGIALRAAAKGAFAEARALIPWYRKPSRWILVAILLVVAGAASTSGSSISELTATDTTQVVTTSVSETTIPVTTTLVPATTVMPTSGSVGAGFGSQDASADVEILSCGKPDAIGFRYPKVKVTNTSSQPSDYMITMVFESKDGSVKHGDSYFIVNRLLPGQSATEDGMPVSDVPTAAICKLTEVQRTAS